MVGYEEKTALMAMGENSAKYCSARPNQDPMSQNPTVFFLWVDLFRG
jgi:hypothetical protein